MNFLIVDDDPFIIKIVSICLQTIFKDTKLLIRTSKNGENAIKLIKSGRFIPDVIIIDFMMKDLDGIRVSKDIKSWAKKNDLYIYTIMITSITNKENEIKSLKVVDDFIHKPINIDFLTARINNAIKIIKLFKEKDKLINKKNKYFEQLLNINDSNETLIEKLSIVIEKLAINLSNAIEFKDPITKTHVLKVGYLAELISKELKVDYKTRELSKYAGFFHDIGKIGIPDDILLKPGKLTSLEFKKIKEHPSIGVNILKPIKYFNGIEEGILSHHERWDGQGYPNALKGEKIPILASIISVADVYDVIISPRPYKKPRSKQEAYEEISKNSGSQFHPKVVDVFQRLYKEGAIDDLYKKVSANTFSSL